MQSRRTMHECIGNSTRSEDSRDGLRQCRHECIYASRLNKIKETPAHPYEWGCEQSWGSGRGRFKNTDRDRSGISTAYPFWLSTVLNLSLAQALSRRQITVVPLRNDVILSTLWMTLHFDREIFFNSDFAKP